MNKKPSATPVRSARRTKVDPLPSLHEATRAAVIAAQEAAKSLREQAPATLEEMKAQGKLTSFHPSEMDEDHSDSPPAEPATGAITRASTGSQPTVRQELDRLSNEIVLLSQEDFRRGRSDAPSGQLWPNGKPITRHQAAVLDLTRIEFERRRLDEAQEPRDK